MSDKLVLDFPVLQQGGGDFADEVSYTVEGEETAGEIKITHTLKGQSFIRRLIEDGDAKFSVLLFYPDRSQRQSHVCETENVDKNNNGIVATQIIPIDFSYAPEVRPSIVILTSKKITVKKSSGLTDFWEQGEHFNILEYSRIAIGRKLKFTSGNISKLMKVIVDINRGDGEMAVVVQENAGEGETPVTLLCAKDVFDQLHKASRIKPHNATESMRWAIATQALCAVYAYMQNLDEDYEVGGPLLAHLEVLEKQTGENWTSEGFDPSLAATKMHPYVLENFDDEVDDD